MGTWGKKQEGNEISKKKLIKESLLKQLKKKHANIAVFEDLIDDYMSLFDVKNACKRDIKQRGITFEEVNSKGAMVKKENPSVKNLINTNKQMLSIIDKLKLDPNSIESEDDADDNL